MSHAYCSFYVITVYQKVCIGTFMVTPLFLNVSYVSGNLIHVFYLNSIYSTLTSLYYTYRHKKYIINSKFNCNHTVIATGNESYVYENKLTVQL